MKYLPLALILILTVGCASTTDDETVAEYKNLAVIDGVLADKKWEGLARVSPMYPVNQAKKGGEGCATFEYVITPDYQITSVRRVDATDYTFAKEARKSLKKWNFSALPAGLLDAPIKTQTRFDFCLRDGTGRCDDDMLAKNTQCSGTDMMPAVGTIIRKGSKR